MEKRTISLALIFMVVGACNSVVLALTPMGPPRASLQEGQWALGLEFEHNQMDLESFGPVKETQYLSGSVLTTTSSFAKYEINNLKSNMYLARLGVGTWENWDLFLRFGASGAQDEISEVLANGAAGTDQYRDYDGGLGFAWGFSTRATFYEQGDTTWGGLLQITWANPDSSDITNENDSTFSGDVEINYWEVQVAIGPTVEFENLRIYGGPFLHFLNGDLDLNGQIADPPGVPDLIVVDTSHDIREKSQLGGYAGAQWYLDANSSLFTEFQFTGDAWGVGVGTIWKF
jgi:hypothetical protein